LNETRPSSHFYEASGLRLHYLLWGDETNPPLFFVHGGRDHAHMWDGIAEAFAATYAVYVPDLRGHGDSAWSSASQYAIPDFVTDLTALVERVRLPRGPHERVTLIGHSRGGGIVLRYAGTFPERVSRVVSIDGIGRHTRWEVPAPQRLRAWIERRLEADTWEARVYPSIEAAIEPAMRNNPRLNREQALELARSGTQAVEGGVRWKFDPRVRFHPSYDFGDEELKSFFAAIEAPVLLIRGDESHLGERNLDEWAKEFPNARAAIVPGAGHWVQHEQPQQVIWLIREFLAEPAPIA
jgi:pimeloyl-ACP methyl ester carboxylesterase